MPANDEIKCSVCGSPNVMAKIRGRYYCYKCGARLMQEHVTKLLESLREKGMIEL